MQLSELPTLTEVQREEARVKAKETLLSRYAKEPKMENFLHQEQQRYSPGVELYLTRFLYIFIAASFILSAIHVYFASKDAYAKGINDPVLVVVAGFSSVVMTELAVIFFSMAPAVLDATMDRKTKILSQLMALLAAFVAVIGNVAVAIEYRNSGWDWIIQWFNSFSSEPMLFVMATLPPMFVLGAGMVLKSKILAQNERQFAANVLYKKAKEEYDHLSDNVETHTRWYEIYAATLWDVWIKGKRKDKLALITVELKRAIVIREMESSNWNSTGIPQNVPNRSNGKRNSSGIEFIPGVPKSDQVAKFLTENPQFLDMPREDSALELGTSIGTLQRGIEKMKEMQGDI